MSARILKKEKKATKANISNFLAGFKTLIVNRTFIDKARDLFFEGFDPLSFRAMLLGADFTMEEIQLICLYGIMKGSKVSKKKGLSDAGEKIRKAVEALGVVDKDTDGYLKVTVARVMASFPLETVLMHAFILQEYNSGDDFEYTPAVNPYACCTVNMSAAYFMPAVASTIKTLGQDYEDSYTTFSTSFMKAVGTPEDKKKNITITTNNILAKGLPFGLYTTEEEKDLRALILKTSPKGSKPVPTGISSIVIP